MSIVPKCRKIITGSAVMVACMALTVTPVAAAGFKATDVGSLGGDYIQALGINNAGRVVGQSSATKNSYPHAFMWQKGQSMRDLGTLGTETSVAQAINDKDQVAGYSTDKTNRHYSAVLWQKDGTLVDLHGKIGGTASIAYAINNNGDVAGTRVTGRDTYEAFVLRGNKLTIIGPGIAFGMNDKGSVVGTTTAGGGPRNAFVWKNGTLKQLQHLAGLEAGIARDINNKEQIVGAESAGYTQHAVMWQGDKVTHLPSLGGGTAFAYSINEAGTVAGNGIWTGTPTELHAALWKKGKIIDLGIKGYNATEAVAINEKEQIAGYHNVRQGNSITTTRGFFMEPDTNTVPTQPGNTLNFDGSLNVTGNHNRIKWEINAF